MYDLLFRTARAAFRALDAQGDGVVMQQYSGVLECLLRLRQACCCGSLVPPQRLERARRVLQMLQQREEELRRKNSCVDVDEEPMDAEEAQRLLQALIGLKEGDEECAVCLDELQPSSARVLRKCRHTFCGDCLEEIIRLGNQGIRCPLCRSGFDRRDVLSMEAIHPFAETEQSAVNLSEKTTNESLAVEAANETVQGPATGPATKWSPKVAALVTDLSEALRVDPTTRCVVFSHFVTFLDVIKEALKEAGISFVKLDGGMAFSARQGALNQFRSKSSGGPSALLVSTRAGGVGLNLVEACRVYMMDFWWNAAVDDQAIDRVHRLGQTRPVTVVRFLCADSIEEHILQMQDLKMRLGAATLRRLDQDELRGIRVNQLRALFRA